MAQKLYFKNDNEWCVVWSSQYRGKALLLNKTVPRVEHFCEHARHALHTCFKRIILLSYFVENKTDYCITDIGQST